MKKAGLRAGNRWKRRNDCVGRGVKHLTPEQLVGGATHTRREGHSKPVSFEGYLSHAS